MELATSRIPTSRWSRSPSGPLAAVEPLDVEASLRQRYGVIVAGIQREDT
jgi:hypothetical protein